MSGMANWKAKIELDIKDLQKQLIDADEKIDKFANEDRKVKLDIDTKTLESAIQKLDKMLDSLGKGTGDFKQFENLSKELSSIVSEVQSLSKAFGKVDDSGTKTLLSSIQNIDKSLSELSQNILNVNKNMSNMGGNTSGAVKQAENISDAYQNVAKEAEKLADAQSKIGQKTNISSEKKDAFPSTEATASVEKTTQAIREENNALDETVSKAKQAASELTKTRDIVSQKWKQWVDMMELFDQASKGSAESAAKLKDVLDNIKAPSLDKYENKLASYQTKKGAYNATIARFNDGGWTSDEYLKNVQAVKDAVNEYETLLNELKGKDASLVTSDDISKLDEYEKKIKDAIATVTNMSAAEKGYNFVSGQKELDKIHKLLNENSKMSSEAKAKIKAYYTEIESGNPSMSLDRIHGEIMKIYNAEVEAGRAGRSFFDTLKNSGFHQLAAQMSGMFGFYDVINIGKQAISTIVSLDDALVDLKKTTAMNKTQLEQYYYDANDVAKQMGVTTEEIINQSSAWSRLGYNTAEASTEMAKLSSQFASISPGMGVDEAQSGLVSIMKAWSIDPDQVKSEIMDPINQLGNTMAEDNQDIVEGMERSAAALAAVGTSTKDAFALFSGIQEVLQNAEKSGTSLKSVALRLRSFDETTGEYSEDLANITGELIDLTKTAEHAEGVSIFKPGSTTEFKDLTDYFREIAGIWDEMTQKQQNDFLIKAFGRNQAQAGAALIQNFKAVDKALAEMGESAGSSDKEMEAVESSLSYKINALKETWVGCVQDMIDRGDLGTIVTGLTKVSEAITFLLDKLGILGSIGLGAGIFSGIKNVGGNKMHFPMNILDNIHNLLWIQRFRVCYP